MIYAPWVSSHHITCIDVIQVARLRALIGGLEVGGVEVLTAASTSTSAASKPRLRSLTPSAEKLRVSTLQQQQQQQFKVVANGNETSRDQVRLTIWNGGRCVDVSEENVDSYVRWP